MPSTTLDEALNIAIKHHQSGHAAEAEKVYRTILAQHPDCADALRLLGLLCSQSRRNSEAIDLMRHLAGGDPNARLTREAAERLQRLLVAQKEAKVSKAVTELRLLLGLDS